MIVKPDCLQLTYSGRIDFADPNVARFIFVASNVEINFTGESISIYVENFNSGWDNYLGYIIDGIQGKIKLSNDTGVKKYTLAENLNASDQHILLLFKRQDACHIFNLYGFELEGNNIKVLSSKPKPRRKIEVFGDSISCGEIVEATNYEGMADPKHNGEYSNAWYSYSWFLARKLDAELHSTSQGGVALLDGTGYFCAPNYIGMETVFTKLQYNPQIMKTNDWDFSLYEPHVAIVSLGQNDSHPYNYMHEDYYSKESIHWRNEYEKFIKKLMSIYPRTHFILITNIMIHSPEWDKAIADVCHNLNTNRVEHFMFTRNGKATAGHPRINESQEMAEELAKYIDSLGDAVWDF